MSSAQSHIHTVYGVSNTTVGILNLAAAKHRFARVSYCVRQEMWLKLYVLHRAVATSTVGPVSIVSLFEATTTFLPIFGSTPSRPV